MNTQPLRINIGISDNTSGITDHIVFVNQSTDFVGTGIPSGTSILVPLGAENGIVTYSVNQTGYYYFRVYAYNGESNLYSTGYVSGSVLVDSINSIKDLIVGSARTITASGTVGVSGNKIFNTFELNPIFNWDVGSQNNSLTPSDYNTRITLRYPSEDLYPIQPIIYENIITTSGRAGGNTFSFSFDTNKALPGGPYRNYDFVAEAIDREGYTSAGNTAYPQSVVENGWFSNPQGYDIIKVKNEPISGFYLTSGTGVLNYNGANYNTYQYFDANGNALIKFSGISLPADIVGGRIFCSRTGFTYSGITGNTNVVWADFQIDNQDSAIFAQTRLNTYGLRSGYMALMLFDSFDAEYKRSNPNYFWTGLYMSNVVQAPISGNLSELAIANFIEFFNNNNFNGQRSKVYITSTGGNSYKVVQQNASGIEYIVSSYKE